SDALSGEFLPALARDVHWLILPLLAVLYKPLFARSEEPLKMLQVAVALSLMIICYRLIDGADGVYNWVRPPIFGHIRRLAMTAGLMSLFLYYDVEYRRYERWLLIVGRILGLALLLWSGSRGALLAWLLGLCTFIWFSAQQSRLRGWFSEAGIAFALALLFDVGSPFLGVFGGLFRSWNQAMDIGTIDGISSGRLTLWLKTLGALQDPYTALFGAGGNGFVRMQLMTWKSLVFHPHNIILQVLLDWGIGGLCLLLWLVKQGLPPRATWKPGKGNAAGLGAALMVFLLVTGLLDGGLYHLQYLFFAAIAFALVAQPATAIPCDGKSIAKKIAIPRLGIACLLFVAIFLHWAVRDYRADRLVIPLQKPYVARHLG
ncbi:MAG: O-antigen ligase family protein, partial [Rugosibacter sp.]